MIWGKDLHKHWEHGASFLAAKPYAPEFRQGQGCSDGWLTFSSGQWSEVEWHGSADRCVDNDRLRFVQIEHCPHVPAEETEKADSPGNTDMDRDQ